MLPNRTGYADAVVASARRVTEPEVGMAPRRRAEVAEAVGEIVHSARPSRSPLPLAESRAINVDGTRQILELAELAARRGMGCAGCRMSSTAYVAGDRRGSFGEDDLDVGQGFRNAYEAVEVRGRADSCASTRTSCRSRSSAEHRGRRGGHRLDAGLQRHLLAAAGVLRAAPTLRSRHERRRRSTLVPVSYVADAIFDSRAGGALGRDIQPGRRRAREHSRRAAPDERRVLRPEGSSDDSGGDLPPGRPPGPRAAGGDEAAEGRCEAARCSSRTSRCASTSIRGSPTEARPRGRRGASTAPTTSER